MIALLIVSGVLLTLVGCLVVVYNRLCMSRGLCREAWRQLEASIDGRHQLVLELRAMLDQALRRSPRDASAAAAVIEGLATARAATRPAEISSAEVELTSRLYEFMEAVIEKLDPGQAELLKIVAAHGQRFESQISASARYYNSNVAAHNRRLRSASARPFARWFPRSFPEFEKFAWPGTEQFRFNPETGVLDRSDKLTDYPTAERGPGSDAQRAGEDT